MLKKVPHTYTIVFSIIIICAILTWIIPGGEYARETVVDQWMNRHDYGTLIIH